MVPAREDDALTLLEVLQHLDFDVFDATHASTYSERRAEAQDETSTLGERGAPRT
jgi:hypothetical protein